MTSYNILINEYDAIDADLLVGITAVSGIAVFACCALSGSYLCLDRISCREYEREKV